MSLEHIFRNLNDIRVFDTMSSCQFYRDSAIKFDLIMSVLDLPQREEIQIQDSIDHLIEQEIIGVTYTDAEYTSGCRICKETDNNNLQRKNEHESHKPEIKGITKIPMYYLLKNKLNFCLTSAVMESSFMSVERITEE